MSLTFYFAPMSTASTVHWSLEELGIPYEAVQVDLKDDADKKRKIGLCGGLLFAERDELDRSPDGLGRSGEDRQRLVPP